MRQFLSFPTTGSQWSACLHLLRKAIRFTLLRPDNEEYKTFLNGLLDVYRSAKRVSADQRLKETGRAARVAELVDKPPDRPMFCAGFFLNDPR